MNGNGHFDPSNRIDFVFLFDVRDGNPNGDPDAGNAPRIDPETGQGLVSDVSLKRKVRDYVAAAKGDDGRFAIYVKLHSALHERRAPAYKAVTLEEGKVASKAEEVTRARRWMCENYFDVRTFGAVMGVKEFNCGQVRGPVQVTFGRSIDPIADLEQSITLKAVQASDKAEEQRREHGYIVGDLGRKSIVPYALYRSHVFYNPHFARDTGFDGDDLALLVDALKMMFELDRSATRGEMSARALVAFQHSSPLGSAPAAALFERVKVERADEERPPRSFGDYRVSVDESELPSGVSCRRLL